MDTISIEPSLISAAVFTLSIHLDELSVYRTSDFQPWSQFGVRPSNS